MSTTQVNFLADLNPMQQQAVKATEGPVLVLAGAGSGKTRVLTYRVAYLIAEKHVTPESILVVTFTNKAAAEMKNRIRKLLTSQLRTPNSEPTMGTFHAICSKILRRDGQSIGLTPGFTIYDESDALDAIKLAMANLNIPTKQINPHAVRNTISGCKNELISELEYPQYARGYFQDMAAKIYLEYQKILTDHRALDFDDLISKTIKLFQTQSAVLTRYQISFKYILVDEYQDTNAAQYQLIKMLAHKNRNVCVVGDASQCLLPETQIAIPSGLKRIEEFKKGDLVIVAAGRGKTHFVSVQKVKQSNYRGKVFILKTKSGKVLKLTPNHILFARLNTAADIYYVYLMFRQDKGYRIGIAKGTRVQRRGDISIGLMARANQESADKMWILKVCKNRSEAIFWEHWFVVEYGIPSMVFSTGNRSMLITQEQINHLFESINTRERAKKLFNDLYLFEEYPHHHPKGVASRISPDRQIVHFTLFSDKRPTIQSPWSGHRVSINTSNRLLEKQLKNLGHYTRIGNRNTWRIEAYSWNYEKALYLAEKIASDGGGLTINHSAFIADNKKFLFTPASHIRETMEVGILEKEQIVADEIVSVETEYYQGPVYDLDVATLHNYCANGIIVHNSIYGFRGADFRNIVNFKNDYPQAKIFNLEQNYRSTQTILDAAHALISENKLHPILKLWTSREGGAKISVFQARNEVEEALYVLGQIKEMVHSSQSDFAILYRTNAQSRVLEEALLKNGIPYRIFGGVQFYERKEIKDVLSYLKLIQNPNDSISKKRIEKIGKGRAAKFYALTESLRRSDSEQTTLQLLDLVLEKTGYLEYLDDGTDEGKSRVENVKELRSVAEEFPGLVQFLENVTLVQDSYHPNSPNSKLLTPNSESDAVSLMTLHASKGLEFKVVFIVGMEEGLLPHSRVLLDPSQLEEERRLAYVGITRAKNKLFLTYTRTRLYFGSRSNNLVSRFLVSVPEHLLEQKRTWLDI